MNAKIKATLTDGRIVYIPAPSAPDLVTADPTKAGIFRLDEARRQAADALLRIAAIRTVTIEEGVWPPGDGVLS